MKNALTFVLSLALVSSSFAGFTPAMAQTAQGMDDLIGARGSSMDSELERRGYKYERDNGTASLWWNSSKNSCISSYIDNGRVQSIQTASAKDCGKSSSNSTAAGILAGAAAVGLIAALAGHHKSTKNARNNSTYNTEYERGYNDALYGGHYSTQDSEGYHSGYMAGESEQNNRRHANSVLVRGAPKAAQNACKQRGDEYWGLPEGSTVPVSVFDYGQSNYEVTVASGHKRANCSVSGNGQISDFNPM